MRSTHRFGVRRCMALKCPNPASQLVYCYQHWPALGEELQARLTAAHRTGDWPLVLDECQQHLAAVRDWVKTNVTGGSAC